MYRGFVAGAVAAVYFVLAGTAAARSITWSGYTWDIRSQGLSGPGPNYWSDSPGNVSVDGTTLVLSIVKDAAGRWTSAEVDNRSHLGYGTYRWVVDSDLSAIDAHEVLGLFTWGDVAPSNNEIDIEAARWGNPAWPTGSGTVWQDFGSGLSQSRTFAYSNRPPYVNQFTWEPGKVTYLITDASGAVLLNSVVTRGVPVPSVETPIINYWRFQGQAPAAPKSMRIGSFAFTPLGAAPAPTPVPPPAPLAPTPAPETGGPAIKITSPTRSVLRRGAKRSVRFACADPSGVRRCSGTLATPTSKASIRSGATVRLVRAGAYSLLVQARDALGNTASKRVRFTVR